MNVSELIQTFRDFGPRMAVVGDRGECSYGELAFKIETLAAKPLAEGAVVEVIDEFGPDSLAMLFSLWLRKAIVIPVSVRSRAANTVGIAQPEYVAKFGELRRVGIHAHHHLYDELRRRGAPGLVLFTSGTTAAPKAVVHDLDRLLKKVARPGRAQTTLAFLGFDHIGGQNTALYCLAHGGCLVTSTDRSPDAISEAIDRYEVQLLPTTPTFLRLFLIEGAPSRHRLDSLELITYGSEPMPENTLVALNEALPDVRKLQQFGMSELGVLRSRSKADDSTWLKLGGPEFEVRVVDGLLQVRAETAMLGYLNAPSPFTEDGWLITGDMAEQDGEWFRLLGRKSEVINIGGEKAHPAEIESVLESMPEVAFASVRGEAHPLVGNIVVARVQLTRDIPLSDFRVRMRQFCASRLPRHLIPQRVELAEEAPTGIKKKRAA